MAEEFRQSATDSLGLPRRMWWLWPFVALLIVIWTISLWAVRVADTETALGVVTSHRGLGTSAQAEVALFVPSSIKTRVLGERVNVACQGISLEGQVFTEVAIFYQFRIFAIGLEVAFWPNDFSVRVFGYSRWSQSPIYKSRHRANIATSQLSAVAFV